MNFDSQICTTEEQSKRLIALGLKAETADMSYQVKYRDPFSQHLVDCTPSLLTYPPINNERFIPAWSLHRLIEIAELPQYWECISGNWYDEVIAHIQSMIHINEFNKEYLEE